MHHHASEAGKFFEPVRRFVPSLEKAIPRPASAVETEAALDAEWKRCNKWFYDKEFRVPEQLTTAPLYPEVLKLLKAEVDCLDVALKDLRLLKSRVVGHEGSIARTAMEIRTLEAGLTRLRPRSRSCATLWTPLPHGEFPSPRSISGCSANRRIFAINWTSPRPRRVPEQNDLLGNASAKRR